MGIMIKYPALCLEVRGDMIENVQLTLAILRHFAKDELCFPANLKTEDLYSIFDKENKNDIDYSIICALQTELLDGEYNVIKTYQGNNYVISYLAGLTARGGDYVRKCENGLFEKAVNHIKESGTKASTEMIVSAVNHLFEIFIKQIE